MILLVDDDPEFLEEARAFLAPLTKRGIFVANDAAHALQALKYLHNEISVTLVDLNLPGSNGFELISIMRENYPDIPVMAISGVYHGSALESAKALGAVEVLSKPIDEEWKTVVRRFDRRAHLN